MMAADRCSKAKAERVSIAERIVEGLALGFGGGGSPIVAVSSSHYSSVAFQAGKEFCQSSVRAFASNR